mmetsp:Transcript_95026/g.306836  ORF Transcript_95026/g.306836 Transcript_95026/m.306836 type:complete len:116 (+) Transcript_95026:931-1278(+)
MLMEEAAKHQVAARMDVRRSLVAAPASEGGETRPWMHTSSNPVCSDAWVVPMQPQDTKQWVVLCTVLRWAPGGVASVAAVLHTKHFQSPCLSQLREALEGLGSRIVDHLVPRVPV